MLRCWQLSTVLPSLPNSHQRKEKSGKEEGVVFFCLFFSPPKLEKYQRELGYRRRAPCLLLVKRSALERQPTDTLLIEWSRRFADSETERLWPNG